MRRAGILLALLLAALGLWGLRQSLLRPDVVVPDVETQPVQDGYQMLYQRSLADFQWMQITLADGGSYAVSSAMVHDANGRLLGVTNPLAQPLTVDGRPDFALSSTAWQMMLVMAQNLPVTQRYEALDLAACGLLSPSARVTLRYTDGSSICLSIGHKTASGASCYVQLEGDPAVYLAPFDLFDVMTRSLNEQHALPGALKADVSSAGQIAVVDPSSGSIIATLSTQAEELLPWKVEAPIRHSADEGRMEALIEGVCAIHAEAYADTVYDTAGLAAYGLDAPMRLIVSFYDGVIRDIHVGADAGGGMVYVRMDSTGDIYKISREQIAFADQATLDWLLDRFAALVPIQQLSHVQIHLPDETVRMEQHWQEGDEAVAFGCAINAVQTDQKTFSAIYASIIGLQFDRTAQADTPAGALRADVRFSLLDGSEITLQIYESTEHYDLITTDGGGRFLIRCERVDEMIQAIKGGQP